MPFAPRPGDRVAGFRMTMQTNRLAARRLRRGVIVTRLVRWVGLPRSRGLPGGRGWR